MKYAPIAVLFLAGFALACVGSEPDAIDGGAGSAEEPPQTRIPPGVSVSMDTVSPTSYQLLREAVNSEDPLKVTLQVLVPSAATPVVVSKTLRVALDSLRRAESSLAAARIVAYVGRMTSSLEMKLYYAAWGEWVPPEGWDSTTNESLTRLHRTFTYSGRPEWDVEAAESND